MSITATTLSGAATASDVQIGVAAATGITAPVTTTGSGFTYLKVDDEMMFVTGLNGTLISVLRGQLGTQSVAHAVSTPVLIGGPADFPNFVPVQGVESPKLPYNFSPIGPPLAIDASNAVAPTNGYIHHVTGTAIIKTITVPAGLVSGGKVTLIFDGSGAGLTWDATDNIALAGSVLVLQAVTFFYDPTTSKWYPSVVLSA